MKKLLAVCLIGLFLTIGGCGKDVKDAEPVAPPAPAWVEYLKGRLAENGEAEIIDWRADEDMGFLWINKLNTPEKCDHVAILGLKNTMTTPPQFHSIMIINEKNVRPGLTPCEAGYGAWAEYLTKKAELKSTMRRKEGI